MLPQLDQRRLMSPARLTRLSLTHPRGVLLGGLFAAVLSLVVTILGLSFHTQRTDLLSPRSEFHQRWMQYLEDFGNPEEVVVIVSGERGPSVRQVMARLGAELERQPEFFRDVHYRFDATRLMSKGLHFLTREQLQNLELSLARVAPLLDDPAVELGDLLSAVRPEEPLVDPSVPLASTSARRPAAAEITGHGERNSDSFWPFTLITQSLRERFPADQLLDDGRLGLVTLHLATTGQGFARGGAGIEQLRKSIQAVDRRYPEVTIGLTGLPVIEYDEMRTSQSDMTWASVASLVGVILLFAAGFGNLRYPAVAAASLLLAILWTCGYLTLAVGHLNILSMSFGVILIGLGIDFAIHYIARYLAACETATTPRQALLRASRSVTPAILVGGLTTAVAFFAAATTQFLGLAELGLIAGGGILLCLLSALLILPAMIQQTSQGRSLVGTERLVRLNRWIEPFWRHPVLTVLAGLMGTVYLCSGLPQLFFDHNLLNLQARGLDSVAWEQRLLKETERSAWFAISLADSREELRERKAQLVQLESVERVEEIVSLVPDTLPAKQELIARIHERLERLPPRPPALTPLEPDRVRSEWLAMRTLWPDVVSQQKRPLRLAANDPVAARSRQPYAAQLNILRTRLMVGLWSQLQELRQIADLRPPTLDDVPAALRARFLGRGGRHLLRIYAQGDLWQMETLERFIRQIQQVDADVTGHPLQAYYACRQMQRSYLKAAGWSTLGVLLVLTLYLRRPELVLLAVLPTALGLLQLLGLLGLLQIPLNPANMIVLPLIIGIGIDDGIHVVHELRRPTAGGRLGAPTTTGIVITSLTSMIGFGTLIMARHEGLRSLGRVVTLGVACCLVTSVVLLPCLVQLARGCRTPESRELSPSR